MSIFHQYVSEAKPSARAHIVFGVSQCIENWYALREREREKKIIKFTLFPSVEAIVNTQRKKKLDRIFVRLLKCRKKKLDGKIFQVRWMVMFYEICICVCMCFANFVEREEIRGRSVTQMNKWTKHNYEEPNIEYFYIICIFFPFSHTPLPKRTEICERWQQAKKKHKLIQIRWVLFPSFAEVVRQNSPAEIDVKRLWIIDLTTIKWKCSHAPSSLWYAQSG